MTFCREETVVEIEPADDRSNVECSTDRIELIVGARHLCT